MHTTFVPRFGTSQPRTLEFDAPGGVLEGLREEHEYESRE